MLKFLIWPLVLGAFLGMGLVPRGEEVMSQADSCARGKPAYVGVKGCKICHYSQWKGWKRTPMAKAFDTLRPGQALASKKKHGLDPKRDYTKEKSCVACHTTGYGQPGGYPALKQKGKWSADETKRALTMTAVQCEACHGAGSVYAPYMGKHMDYKKAEIVKYGLTDPKPAICAKCHNQKCPTIAKGYKLDFKAVLKDPAKVHRRRKLRMKH